MNSSLLIEKWDGVLYSCYNSMISLISLFNKPSFVKKNKVFHNKYKGKRCFVVMNGPSLNSHDLSFLKNEIVFSSNYLFRSNLVNIIDPNFYCWADNNIFEEENCREIFNAIKERCPNARLLINHKGYSKLGDDERIFYVYCKHLPNIFSIKNNLGGVVSNFSTVAFHAINNALFMGFSEIYILGLDFAPGAFKHFADLGAECSDPLIKTSKFDVAGNYWNYTKAHYESYYLREISERCGQKIINLNPDSYIRAFEFGNYEEVIKNAK